MKAIRLLKFVSGFPLAVSSLSLLASPGFAQTSSSNSVPVVTVAATAPFAMGPANPGVFTVFRSGSTNATLNVWYDLGGTASNGLDYAAISPHLVAIPAGAASSPVVITPITNELPFLAKTVVLDLTNSPLASPVNYEIGSPSEAVVFLEGTNFPAPIVIDRPQSGAVFFTPTNILLVAAFSYLSIPGPSSIEFFAGTNDLGPADFGVSSGFGGSASLTWSNPPTGVFALSAVANYNNSLSTTSALVNITVLQGPPTNLPPLVNIVLPTNGETFTAPVSIELLAKAGDPNGTVTNVEFFAGTNDLGTGHLVILDPPGVNGTVGPVYYLNWPNVPPAVYSLTAVATDDGGASTVSAPVDISVIGIATNLPPVVRITSPPNGSDFRAPLNLSMFAYAADLDGTVTTVEFFANSNSLGLGHRVTAVQPILPPGPILPPNVIFEPSNYWELTWSNTPAGTNVALTAEATAENGATNLSVPVYISVLPPLPPPTNRPPAVSIVATDPIAIAGTNCWPWLGLAEPVPAWSNWVGPTSVFRWITNCGPKNATFTVFRIGATNDDLNVNYAIGGTATNGVDYVTLPGVLLVPAGDLTATISVVPIDDGPPEVASTVVLTLSTGTNYVEGRPAAAAAIILDSRSPHPTTGLVPGNLFQLSSTGPNGAWFQVEYSQDMVTWATLCTNQVVNGQIEFVDPDAASQPQRFYRAVPDAGP
jgi:hypothetical protein